MPPSALHFHAQVGSFAGSLFLVGCECEETGYVGSRAFRVNAGPVGDPVWVKGDKKTYGRPCMCARELTCQSGLYTFALNKLSNCIHPAFKPVWHCQEQVITSLVGGSLQGESMQACAHRQDTYSHHSTVYFDL